MASGPGKLTQHTKGLSCNAGTLKRPRRDGNAQAACGHWLADLLLALVQLHLQAAKSRLGAGIANLAWLPQRCPLLHDCLLQLRNGPVF